MRIYKLLMTALLVVATWSLGWAHLPTTDRRPAPKKKVELRSGFCAASESGIDQEINNVRARLLGGGDCWWDFTDGRYIVPKVDPASGQKEVSSIFAASVWLGGVDAAGSLKLACQDYRPSGQNDFWPGPLDPTSGKTDDLTCRNWDRHFRVLGDEIRQHLSNLANGITDPNAIPRGVKGWPAKGNPYFEEVWGFPLPNTSQGLAGFFDDPESNLNNYDPLKGDYPSIEIRGCKPDRYPDEMIFWIYNDEGSGAPHARTKGKTIQMEVQVQSFGYQTSDELNDMTFQRYKLINRATELIDSTFFSFWVDADLGCFLDDYIGCDTLNDLMYTYNQDQVDGQPNCNCPSGSQQVPTYCNDVPILGVDYFRGPRKPFTLFPNTPEEKDTFIEIGMSSFVYYNNPAFGNPDPRTVDPDVDTEFYNYLNGRWRDNTEITRGGSGLNPGSTDVTRYVFPESPNDPTGWSMCNANLPFGDRRTLQTSGPFLLKPGAVNELIIGAPWVPDVAYPCPDIEQLLRADKLAQGLFDNCFERLTGPDAPTVDWIELNQEVVAVLTNDSIVRNNFQERYEQIDFLAPDAIKFSPDPAVVESAKYKFEGYKIYQLINPNVSAKDLDIDPSKARLIAQVDKKNNVAKIYDWESQPDPNDTTRRVYFAVERVRGANQGIKHTFSFDEDRFSTTNDKRLINHRKYYYTVVAYAHNNYESFDPLARPERGQQRPYLPGGRTQIYTVIPRPIVDQALQSAYGDGVEIIRDAGVGVGNNFLDLTDASRDAAAFNNETVLTYKRGRGPINVSIFNPFEVKDGEYEVRFVDENMTDTQVSDTSRWELRQLPSGEVIASAVTIAELNEQIVARYGFSVTIAQTGDAGTATLEKNPANNIRFPIGATNGAIGVELEYKNPDNPWYLGQGDFQTGTTTNFMKTDRGEVDEEFDPGGPLGHMGDGFFYPYALCDWRLPLDPLGAPDSRMLTPAWTGKIGPIYLNSEVVGGANPSRRYSLLRNLPNIDIVFTSDKTKWSRCVIVEAANEYFTTNDSDIQRNPNYVTEPAPSDYPGARPRTHFDCRAGLSVGKDDANGDGLPDPDGEIEPAQVINPSNGQLTANLWAGKLMRGMGWFPGYAVNVETGQRVNIFFSENSCYDKALDSRFTGRDMMYNPTDLYFTELSGFGREITEAVLGSQHYIYVQDAPYDGCDRLRAALTPEMISGNANSRKRQELERRPITWTSMGVMLPTQRMLSYREGLIPNDLTVKIRVANPYQTTANANGELTEMPRYRFRINGQQARALTENEVVSALDSIKAVPNPYFGFSDYETGPLTNIIKITNLPAKCIVTIYSLDGKFIRQYKRAEVYEPYQQIIPDLEWDLKNNKGIPVASGVYLFHVNAYEQGERTIKWFGVARQFDPSGL
jgi:hypothetical protein